MIPDEEGSDFLNLEEARKSAETAARAVMADDLLHGRLCLSCRIDVRDETGATVATILFKDVVTVTGL